MQDRDVPQREGGRRFPGDTEHSQRGDRRRPVRGPSRHGGGSGERHLDAVHRRRRPQGGHRPLLGRHGPLDAPGQRYMYAHEVSRGDPRDSGRFQAGGGAGGRDPYGARTRSAACEVDRGRLLRPDLVRGAPRSGGWFRPHRPAVLIPRTGRVHQQDRIRQAIRRIRIGDP